jgi:hypothetical protein
MTRLKSACDDDDDLVQCFLSTDECERVNLTKAVYYAPDSGVQVASWQFTNHLYFPVNAVTEHMLESYPKCSEPLFSARLISRAGYAMALKLKRAHKMSISGACLESRQTYSIDCMKGGRKGL